MRILPVVCALIVLAARAPCAEEEVFTRHAALDTLSSQGLKWRQSAVLQLEADSKSQLARSVLYPQIQLVSRQYLTQYSGLRFGLPEANLPSLLHVGSSSIEFVYFLFDSAARERMQAASENQKLTAFQIKVHQNDLSALALLHYLNAQRYTRRFENTDASVQRSQEILAIAQARVKTGAGLKLDVLRAQALVATENTRKLDAFTARQKAYQELATLLGLPTLTRKLEALQFRDFKPIEPDADGIDRLADTRPDVESARHLLEAASHLKAAAIKDGYPKITLAADLGFIGSQTVLGFGNGSPNGSVGLQLSIPIYTGGRLTSRESEEGAKVVQAEMNLAQTALDARAQIRLVIEQIGTARSAVASASDAVAAATEELRLATERFRGGSSSGVEVRNAAVGLATATDLFTEAVFAFEATKISYFRNVANIAGAAADKGGG